LKPRALDGDPKSDRIIRCVSEILFRAKIPLGRLDGSVAEQHLYLLQFAGGGAAQLRACASKVVRRNAGNTDLGGIASEHLPNDLFAQALASNGSPAAHRAENMTDAHVGDRSPRVDRHLHPGRHRRGANPAVFSDNIDNAPATVALLNMCERQRGHFRPPQSAAEEDGEDGAIALPSIAMLPEVSL
jgi:hypothetical protein